MTLRNLLLVLHITGVAGWLGANFVQLVLSPRFDKEPTEVAAAWTRQTMFLGERYYGAVGGLIAVTGVLLVIETSWNWSAGFVGVGIFVVVVGGILGLAQFTPLAKRRAEALEAGDRAAADAAQRRIIPLAILDTLLVLTAVLVMVGKWQA